MSTMGPLSAEARAFLFTQIIGAAIANVPINAGLAWLSFPEPTAPVFARGPCVAFDTIGTSLCLPLVTCLVLTPIVRRLAKNGKAPAFTWSTATKRAFGWLPRSTFLRGLALGGLSMVLVAPFALGLLKLLGLDVMSRGAIVAFKGVYGAVLAAIITTPAVICALAPRE